MIENRIKISSILENQLPEFIRNEYPLVSEFLSEYYRSLEYNGNCYDLISNIDQYVKIDNIANLTESTTLSSDISFIDDVISVSSTLGFPEKYGLIQIDDEIISYTGITTNSFTGCIRGFVGVTSYINPSQKDQLVFSTSESSNHNQSSTVKNLSILFLKEFFKKIKVQFSPGFENQEFYSGLNESLFLKQSGDFYKSKGTDASFKILFGALYGKSVDIIKPRDYLIRPSDAQYSIFNTLVVESIEGNPLNLLNKTLIQDSTDFFSEAMGTVARVEEIERSGKKYYNLGIDYDYNRDINVKGTIKGKFSIHPKTRVISFVEKNSTYIDVDSTIGFPNSGTLNVTLPNDIKLIITYGSKSLNQFFDCEGISEDINSNLELVLDSYAYAYDNDSLIKVRVTGVLEKLNFNNAIIPYLQNKNNTIEIKTLGDDSKDIRANNWLFNISVDYNVKNIQQLNPTTYSIELYDEHSFVVGDSITINNNSDYTAQVIGILNEKNITITPNYIFNMDEVNNIRKNISKINCENYPELNIYNSNVQNVYNDLNGSFYVASPSLPSYLNQQLTVNDGSIVFSGTYIQEQYEIDLGIEHNFYTGDAIIYTVSDESNISIETGVYYIKRVDSNTIKLARSRENIFLNNFIDFFGNVSNDRISFYDYVNSDLSLKTLQTQKLVRKISLPLNEDKKYSTLNGPIGIFANGVELLNYKSKDIVFYGKIEKIIPTSSGSNYDVINPPLVEIVDSIGYGASASCSVTGSLERIDIIDPGFDYIEKPIISITGGNGSGIEVEPNLIEFVHIVNVNSQSGLNTTNSTIGFSTYHKLRNFEEVIYDTQGQSAIVGLVNGSNYIVSVINSTTIKLYKSISDASSGINTISISGEGSGTHFLKSTTKKKKIGSISIKNSGSGYSNKKRIALPVGISTYSNTITIPDHAYKSGEIIRYDSTNVSIGGLSSSTSYYVTKLDENTFKLSEVGIGTNQEQKEFFYKSKQYINITSIGSGNHIFNYPPIEISIKGKIGIQSYSGQNFNAVLNPVIRGKIDSIFIENGGSNYGSSDIVNYNRSPKIELLTGSGAEIIPIISSDGRIVDVNIQKGGENYYSYPDLIIIGSGQGAVLTPIISNGSIVDVKIVSTGSGYQNGTIIQINPSGSNAKFDILIKKWNFNLVERFINNISDDGGFIYPGINPNYGLEYTHFYASDGLRSSLFSKNIISGVTYFISDLENDTQATKYHSPILGWAYDGNPIYGPYGYSSANGYSSIKSLKSGYILKSQNQLLSEGRPSNFDLYPIGIFVEDYVFSDFGDLDENNGRFCITPEYPNGTYAYFCTLDDSKNPEFPYVIGNYYKSTPIEFNFSIRSNQDNVDFNANGWVRNTTPYNLLKQNSGYSFINDTSKERKEITKVSSINSGNILSVGIVTSGKNYQVGDKIIFDNSNTSGRNLSAYIKNISGKTINQLGIGFTSFKNVEFTSLTTGEFLGFTTVPHNLFSKDTIVLSGEYEYNKISQINVTTNTLSLTVGVGTTGYTGLVTYFNVSGNLKYPTIRENDVYKISNEEIKVLEIDATSSRIKVIRNQNKITGISSYSPGTNLVELPRKFTTNLGISSISYNYKINKEYYFNPIESISQGVSGVSSTLYFSNPGSGKTSITVPLKSIYLPNHNLKTGTKLIYSNNNGSSISVSTSVTGTPFTLENNSTVYVGKITNNLIGISTYKIGINSVGEFVSIGQTPSGLLYFTGIGSGIYHSFKTNYDDILSADIYKNYVTVSLASTHSMKIGDEVDISVRSGITTYVKVIYNDYNRRVIINPKSIESIDFENNLIKISNHNFNLGEKVIYNESSSIGGLTDNKIYFIVPVNKDFFKVSTSYYETTKSIPNTVNLTSSGSGTFSSINPEIKIIRGQTLVFDLSDSSLSYITNSIKSAFDFSLYRDVNFRQKFEFSGFDVLPEVTRTGIVGVDINANVTLKVTDNIPNNLYYKLTPINLEDNLEVKKQIIFDSEQQNNNLIKISNSVYSGLHLISNVSPSSFTYNLEDNIPEVNLYTSNNSKLSYTTSSKNEFGPINDIEIKDRGKDYIKIPKVTKIQSNKGENGIIEVKSNTIGKLNKVKLQDIGYNYSIDLTIRPKAKIPQVLKVNVPSIFDSIGIVTSGLNYTSSPKLVAIDGLTNSVINDVELEYNLGDTQVKIKKNTDGISDLTPKIIPVNNSNGVGINSISYDDLTKDVLITFKGTFFGSSQFPFSIGDQILIENTSIEGSGKGYNSEDYNYSFFTVSQVGINLGITTNPTLTYNLGNYLSGDEVPGTYDNTYIDGSVVPVKNMVSFSPKLTKKAFLNDEMVKSGSSSGLVQNWDNNSYLTILSGDDFIAGNPILGKTSNILGTISESYNFNNIFYDISSSSILENGWDTETGFLNNSIQRIHDSDYYQYFSYSLKSDIQISEWDEIVKNLNHTAGFKKFGDLLVENILAEPVGILTVSGNFSDIFVEIDSYSDIGTFSDFDLAREGVVKFLSGYRSSEIYIKNVLLKDYYELVGNKVLILDDISNYFDGENQSFNITSNGNPVFKKEFTGVAISTTDNYINLDNHFFVTGEEVSYVKPTDGTGISIASTYISGIGITDILPPNVYIVKDNLTAVRVSGSASEALRTIPSVLQIVSVGTGTTHTFISKDQNTKVLVSIDNEIQTPMVSTAVTTTLSSSLSIGINTLSVTGVTSISSGNYIKIEDEFMKVISVSPNNIEVSRGLLGTNENSHNSNSLIRKVIGNYNIVDNKIYFTSPPFGNVPEQLDSPDELDYTGLTTHSSFSGRVFLRSGFTNGLNKTYFSNVIFDDISHEFNGITKSFTLKNNNQSVTGISTGNSIITVNNILQSPNKLNVPGNYYLTESSGDTNLNFTGSATSISYDVNNASIPRGGVIISIGSTSGFGYQPLVSAGGTAIVSISGTIQSVSIGNSGSGYRSGIQSVKVGVGTTTSSSITYIGIASIYNGNVIGVNITNPGSGYTSTKPPYVIFDSPLPYSNIPLVYSSPSSGFGTESKVDIVVGQGSSVISFEIKNFGYGYKIGDRLTVEIGGSAGIPTTGISSFTTFEISVDSVFNDNFSGWYLGDFKVFDTLDRYFDGNKTSFAIRTNNTPQSISPSENGYVNPQDSLLVFINDVLQVPGVSYTFDGSFIRFNEAPNSGDTSKVLLYEGTSSIDVIFKKSFQTIKSGDGVSLIGNDLAYIENERIVTDLKSARIAQTNTYLGPGISTNESLLRPINWRIQREDLIINGIQIGKDRQIYEPSIYPITNIISNVSVGSTEIFVNNLKTFFDSENEVPTYDVVIQQQDEKIQSIVTANVSGGAISSIDIQNPGKGYNSEPSVVIGSPTGLGVTGIATASISGGQISLITLVNPGSGYTVAPQVIISPPTQKTELINDVNYEGDFGIISGINTTVYDGSNALIFDLYIPENSYLRDSNITNPIISQSTISSGYYFTISNSNVSGIITSKTSSGSVIGVGTFIDNVYQVAYKTNAQGYVPGVSGLQDIVKVIVKVDYSNLTGIGVGEYYGNYSWGRISNFTRRNPQSFDAYNSNGSIGISTSPILYRYDSLKSKDYLI